MSLKTSDLVSIQKRKKNQIDEKNPRQFMMCARNTETKINI